METFARFRVRGVVQGVGYRWWCRRVGTALGVGGGVRNLPDGSVEVLACGSSAPVDELERRLARGPALARVDSVERHSCDRAEWLAQLEGSQVARSAGEPESVSPSEFRILS